MKNKISILTGNAGSGKTELIKNYLSDMDVQNVTVFDILGQYSLIERQEERNIKIFNYPFYMNRNEFPLSDFSHTLKNVIDKGDKIIIDEAFFFCSTNTYEITQVLNYLSESATPVLLIFQDSNQVQLTPVKDFEYNTFSIDNVEEISFFHIEKKL